jgi:hypothetical protein
MQACTSAAGSVPCWRVCVPACLHAHVFEEALEMLRGGRGERALWVGVPHACPWGPGSRQAPWQCC